MISALDRARRISAIAQQPTVPHSASSKKRETMLQDFRYALRTIRQAPGFAVVVTLTIAVGVGATTAMFSVVDAVLLRPLPYPAQASLVKLFDTQSGRDVAALSFPEFMDWRDRGSDVFESIGAYGARGEVLSGAGETEQLLGVQASLEVPGLLGLHPIVGRGTQTVVGVVADIREGGLDEQPKAAIYISRAQRPHFDMHIIVRTSRVASEVMKLIRASVADLDAALPVIDIRSAGDIVAASARPQQLTGNVIAAFAVSAPVLAAIGLYGLISYSVAQRRQELGIRAAIGAQPRDLVRLVLGQSLRVTVIGIVWGAAAALAVSRLLSAQLFGVGGGDPRVYTAVALLIFVVALLASALPTLRATRANPLDALRTAQ
jgi:hypothetical protein